MKVFFKRLLNIPIRLARFLLLGLWHFLQRCWVPLLCLLIGFVILICKSSIVESGWLKACDRAVSAWKLKADPKSASVLLKTTSPQTNIVPEPAQHLLPEPNSGNKVFDESLIEEIGIALVVAGLIGLFVENTLRKREEKRHIHEQKELADNVFRFVLGSFAPSWITRELLELFRIQAMRSNVKICYTFEEALDLKPVKFGSKQVSCDDLVKVTFTIRYTLKNLTKSPFDPKIRHAFEPTVPGYDDECQFQSLTIDHDSVQHKWTKGHPTSFAQTKGVIWNEKSIEVNDFKIQPDKDAHVEMTFTCIRWRHDHDTWLTRLSANKVEIEVKHPSGYEFNLINTRRYAFQKVTPGTRWESGEKEESKLGAELHEKAP